MICKHCKAENEDGALFCSNCGKPLEDEEHERVDTHGNTKLYIGISIALMIFLAGGLVFGFFYFSSKVQKANDERNTIASESDVAANYFRSQIREQEDAISELQAEIELLKGSISDYQENEEAYKKQIADLTDKEEAMEGLASFTDAVPSQGYEDMFVSDTFLRFTIPQTTETEDAESDTDNDDAQTTNTNNEAVLRVCISGDIEVSVKSSDESVASFAWDTTPVGPSVARLRVIPGKKGTAILTFTNNLNDEQIQVYVYVQ